MYFFCQLRVTSTLVSEFLLESSFFKRHHTWYTYWYEKVKRSSMSSGNIQIHNDYNKLCMRYTGSILRRLKPTPSIQWNYLLFETDGILIFEVQLLKKSCFCRYTTHNSDGQNCLWIWAEAPYIFLLVCIFCPKIT